MARPPGNIVCFQGRQGKAAISWSLTWYPRDIYWPGGVFEAGLCLRGTAVSGPINADEGIHLLVYSLAGFSTMASGLTQCVNMVSPIGEYETCVDPSAIIGERVRELSRQMVRDIERGLSENLNMAPAIAAVVAIAIVAVIIVAGSVVVAI